MEIYVKNKEPWGRVLWLEDEKKQVGIALDFGIRIVHLSCAGRENLYYQQPDDLSDGLCQPNGWRVYGGHRIWLAPESPRSYEPDNAPVENYTVGENCASVTQSIDTVLGIRKRVTVTFLPDGGISVENGIENVWDAPIEGAVWGVNTLCGGTAYVELPSESGGFNPTRTVSLWGKTDLHDPRVHFEKEALRVTHLPIPDYFKIGLYSASGRAVYENKNQRLTITFDVLPMSALPDNGCNFELYLGKWMMELETLGKRRAIAPGEYVSHTETWHLEKV